MLTALESGAEIVGYIDADMATPASEARRLVQTLAEGPATVDAIIGSRVRLLGWKIERSPLRHYLGRVFATAASWTLKMPVYDTQCGLNFFAIPLSLKRRWKIVSIPDGFSMSNFWPAWRLATDKFK